MTGTFAGTRYHVAGRVVMKMIDAGTTYYWDEFHLVNESGKSVTLVWEDNDDGGQWRMFTLFEPARPLTAAEASAKRVGESFRLDGTPLRVTLVDESEVHAIEGQAPEGVELKDVARYFNAESDRQMVVVSWTGEEVEHYRGMDLSAEAVADAFGIARRPATSRAKAGIAPAMSRTLMLWGSAFSLILLAAVLFLVPWRTQGPPASVRRFSAPAAPLAIGARGTLEGTTWQVARHGLVEIAEVGLQFHRHEYELRDDSGRETLLVCGLSPGEATWVWFTPQSPDRPIAPAEAGAKRVGDPFGGTARAKVARIFRSTALPSGDPQPDSLSGVRYGFVGKDGTDLWLVRWNERGLNSYKGKPVAANTITQAFPPKR
jgi:hypothetical protein